MEVLGWFPLSSLLRAEMLGQSSPSFLIAGNQLEVSRSYTMNIILEVQLRSTL